LALFDSLRFKNRKVTKWFFVPKIAFVIILFISSVAHGVYDNVSLFELPHIKRDFIEEGLRAAEFGIYAVYVAWAVVAIVHAAVKVDVTERYKFNLYCAAGVTAVGTMALVKWLFALFSRLKQSSVAFVVASGVENLFVLLMAYFHWPYEVLHEKDLDMIHTSGSAMPDADFFVNEQIE
jgi:hypothetical protein